MRSAPRQLVPHELRRGRHVVLSPQEKHGLPVSLEDLRELDALNLAAAAVSRNLGALRVGLESECIRGRFPVQHMGEEIVSQRRFLVLKIIMETHSALDVEPLEQVLLAEKDVIVKSGLVKVFARLAGESGVETLRTCLADSDARVRANTVEVIEERSIRSCEADVDKLLRDPENRVKVNAAKFLVKCGHMEAFATLRSMLGSSEVWLRDSVIFALGEIGDQPSLTLLKAALKDTNQGIRLSVLKALAKINNMVSREALQASTSDGDHVVAQVARGLWEKIKNVPLRGGPDVAESAVELPVKPVVVGQIGLPPAGLITGGQSGAVPKFSLSEAKSALVETTPLEAAKILPGQPAVLPITLPTEPLTGSPASVLSGLSLPDGAPTVAELPPVIEQKSEVPLPEIPEITAPAVPVEKHLEEVPLKKLAVSKPPASPLIPIVPLPEGVTFQKPRSVAVYNRIMTGNDEDATQAMKDMPFIMGDDQNILIYFAAQHANDGIRLVAAKLLARKRGPHAVELMKVLLDDPSELVSSFAAKALTILK